MARWLRCLCLCAMALGCAGRLAAQGSYFQGLAQSVTTLPGTPQGLSNVVVPIPNASVYVCVGTYTGTACSATVGTPASLWTCQALSGCAVTQPVVGDLYGNFGFWAAAGTYYYTQTGQANGQLVSGTYQLSLPLACGAACQAAVFNATTGFELNGAAPVNHLLLGNGTNYVDVAGIPASIVSGLPGSHYQTMQGAGVAMAQETYLNFASPLFTLSDAAGNLQTNVNIAQTGAQPKVVTAAAAGVSGNCATWNSTGDLADTGAPCYAPPGPVILERWSGNSCALVDDGGGGSGAKCTQSWTTAIAGTYYFWCQPSYDSAVSCTSSSWGSCGQLTVDAVSQTSTTFTYIVDTRYNNSIGHSIPLTCWASN